MSSPKGASQHLCLRLLAGSHGFRGTPWTRSSTPFLGYRRSMVLCRLWWELLVDVLQLFDALMPVAEQVIDVPKIFIERIPPRTSVREPQLADQLVEVPTIVSFSSLQRDYGADRGTFQFRRVVGDAQIFKVCPLDRVQQRRLPPRNAFLSGLWSRSLTLFFNGRLHGSLPGQGSSSSHSPAGVE